VAGDHEEADLAAGPADLRGDGAARRRIDASGATSMMGMSCMGCILRRDDRP
jgi:hypothetical protein